MTAASVHQPEVAQAAQVEGNGGRGQPDRLRDVVLPRPAAGNSLQDREITARIAQLLEQQKTWLVVIS